jgi:hypothetical protein
MEAGLLAAVNRGMAVPLHVFLYSRLLKHPYTSSCGIPFIYIFIKSEVICDLL